MINFRLWLNVTSKYRQGEHVMGEEQRQNKNQEITAIQNAVNENNIQIKKANKDR